MAGWTEAGGEWREGDGTVSVKRHADHELPLAEPLMVVVDADDIEADLRRAAEILGGLLPSLSGTEASVVAGALGRLYMVLDVIDADAGV